MRSFSVSALEAVYNVCTRKNRLQKECELHVNKQHSPVFQAVQGIVNDKADAETVMNGWMMKLGKKENQF